MKIEQVWCMPYRPCPVAAGPVAAGPVAAGPVAAGPVAAGPETASVSVPHLPISYGRNPVFVI